MTIQEVYERYGVTSSLVDHMAYVAQVATVIGDHWTGPPPQLDWDLLIKAALLHDIGNIVKFSLDSELALKMLTPDEKENIANIKSKQQEIQSKYSTDDHEASVLILQELGSSDEFIRIIQGISFSDSVSIARGDDWNIKILFYSDMRVMPHGISSMEERVNDVVARYTKYSSRPDCPELVRSAHDIEVQIASRITISVAEIGELASAIPRDRFLQIQI